MLDFYGKNRAKNAFTMVEITITLLIIGVVAGMTLPVLNKSIKQHRASVGLEKMYSTLRNATRMYQAEYGTDIDDFDMTLSPKDFLNTYFKPYLKGATECTSTSDCWKGKKTPLVLNGAKPIIIAYGYILSDGTILGINSVNTRVKIFTVDIDGAKGDNQAGHDIFNFHIIDYPNRKRDIFPGTYGDSYASYLNFSISALLPPNTRARACNKSAKIGLLPGIEGDSCALVLFKNNWKFPKGYPW